MTGKENIIFAIFKKTIKTKIGSEFNLLVNGIFSQYGYMAINDFIFVDYTGKVDPFIVVKALRSLPSAQKYIESVAYTKTVKNVKF